MERKNGKLPNLAPVIVLAMLLASLAVAAAPVSAQGIGHTVAGYISCSGAPLEGATVVIETDIGTYGPFTSNANGAPVNYGGAIEITGAGADITVYVTHPGGCSESVTVQASATSITFIDVTIVGAPTTTVTTTTVTTTTVPTTTVITTTSGPGPQVVNYDYGMAGYDTFSTPVDVGYTIMASEMETQFGTDIVDMVAYYDENAQDYVSYSYVLVKFGIPQTDFSVVPGRGYMVYVTAPANFDLQGTPVTTALNIVGGGYNLVGYNSLTTSTAVNSYINNANGDSLDMVARWVPADQTWESYSVILLNFGIPQTDFPTTPGKAYYVYANANDQIFN